MWRSFAAVNKGETGKETPVSFCSPFAGQRAALVQEKRGLRFCGAVTLGRRLPLNVRSEQGEVGFAESFFCRLSLMPIRVKQDRLADCIEPGTFLCR
jgi:hypothetical protein